MIRFALYYFVYFANFAVIAPYFQVFLDARGFDKSEVGLLLGCFGLAGATGAVGVGQLADHLGKRRLLLAVTMLASVALLTPLNWITSFWAAVPLVILFGIAYKSTIPLADALAGAELPNPTAQYGRVRALGSLGFVVAGWVYFLLSLLDESSSTSILLCFAGAAALSIPIIFWLPDTHRRPDRHDAVAATKGHFDRSFWLFMAVIFFGQMGMAGFYSFFSLYLGDVMNMAAPGRMWAVGALVEIPFIFFAGWIIRRFGIVRMLAVSLIAMTTRLLLYGNLPYMPAIIAITLLHGFTFGLTHTATIEYIRLKVPRARQGLAMAIYMAIPLGAAQMTGSVLGGYLIEWADYRVMFCTHAAIPMIGLGILLVGKRQLAGEQ